MGQPDEHQDQSRTSDVDDTVGERDVVDAEAIAARRFTVAFRGYDRSEVGHYLQRVAIAHKALADELETTRAALDEERRRSSVVGVSPSLDHTRADEIDVTDDAVLAGEDDEAFDRMVRAALERAVRSDSPYGRA